MRQRQVFGRCWTPTDAGACLVLLQDLRYFLIASCAGFTWASGLFDTKLDQKRAKKCATANSGLHGTNHVTSTAANRAAYCGKLKRRCSYLCRTQKSSFRHRYRCSRTLVESRAAIVRPLARRCVNDGLPRCRPVSKAHLY